MSKLMFLMTAPSWGSDKPFRAKAVAASGTQAQPESRRDRIRRLAREVSERDAKALAILAK